MSAGPARNMLPSLMDHPLERLNRFAEHTGAVTLHLVGELGRMYALSVAVFGYGLRMHWLSRPAVMNVVFRQIYFTGVQGLFWVVLVALGVGVMALYNIIDFARGIQDVTLIGDLVSGLLVQEVAPLLVTVLLLSRSGVAVVTELGTMHVRGEDLTLKSIGISIEEYLLWPRMLAFILCGLILTVTFVFVAVVPAGMIVTSIYEMNFVDFLYEVQRGTSVEELAILFGKGAGFAMLSAMMLLNMGTRVGQEANMIPVYATQGVMGALMLVVLTDAAIGLAATLV